MPRLKSLAPRIKIIAVILGSLVGLAIVAALMMAFAFSPGITVNPDDGASEINPESKYLEIGTSSWGASITDVAVEEVKLLPDGSEGERHFVDGRIEDGRYVLEDGSNPLVSDATYIVTVTGIIKSIGFSGISEESIEQTQTFTTITTPMPIIPPAGVYVKYGEQAVIDWNIPVTEIDYKLEGINSTASIDTENSQVKLDLEKFEQGKEYALTISSAVSANGIDLKQPLTTKVVTAPPLNATFEPADTATGASIDIHPAVVFSEPVSNPEIAGSVVKIEPEVAGSFKWVEPNRLEFIPDESWDHLQDVTISLKGGVSNLRGISGGYVETDGQSTFTTAPFKLIDVNVTEQRLTLFENGVAVESFLCSSGLTSTATPLGDYTIYAKMVKTDMRGEGYFAPDVPWVLVFKGDYTIHGNYWATAFGRRSSHGCVGLPVSTAQHVFEWTPLGTPVHIHE